MRTTKTLTISLPPGMAHQFEMIRQKEQRTRSELVREALRVYFQRQFPEVEPTKAELRAIKKGREEIKRGNFVTLEQLLHDLEASNRKKSAKNAHKPSR